MKPVTASITFFTLLLVCTIHSRQLVDGIAAVVGDSVILMSELRAYTRMQFEQKGIDPDADTFYSDSLHKMQRKYLHELIDGKVLMVKAQRDSAIQLDEDRIEKALQAQIQSIIAREQISMEAFRQMLNSQYNMTLEKYKAQLRSGIKRQFVTQAVIQTYLPSISLTRDEVKEFYETYKDSLPDAGRSVHLSKLAITPDIPDSIRQQAYATMQRIREQLDRGEDFSEIATRYSQGPNSKNGGLIGYISKGSLSSQSFEEKAFSLSPGETSDIFQTKMGFHIIKVTDKRKNEVKVRQIMTPVSVPQSRIDAAKARLDSIRRHCNDTTEFKKAVSRFSEEKISKARHGVVGWQSVYQLPQQLASRIDTLSQGDITRPIKDGKSYVIYRINNKAAHRRYTLENDWELLAEKAKEIHTQKKLQVLVAQWREQMYVDIRI